MGTLKVHSSDEPYIPYLLSRRKGISYSTDWWGG